jgi:hypothetical protein
MTTAVILVIQMLVALVVLMIAIAVKTDELEELKKVENVPIESYSDEELRLLERRLRIEQIKRFTKEDKQ